MKSMKITARFVNLPRCMPVMNRALVQVVEDWCFTVNGKEYWIPAGYTFDGASIPRFFWRVIGSPFDPRFWAAALAHDWIYLMHVLAREVADEIFRQLLIRSGAGRARARTMWSAVRGFGCGPWKNNTTDKIAIGNILEDIAKRADRDRFIVTEAA